MIHCVHLRESFNLTRTSLLRKIGLLPVHQTIKKLYLTEYIDNFVEGLSKIF